MRDERGFTLIELMSVVALLTILMTLGAAALRNFWFVQSLVSAQDEVTSQLKELQEEAVAATDPVVKGAWFEEGSSDWGLVEYDPALGGCESIASRELGSGVVVSEVEFDDEASGVDVGDAVAACNGEVAQADDFVFFLARGTATPGSVFVFQNNVNRDPQEIEVLGLTGRVNKL